MCIVDYAESRSTFYFVWSSLLVFFLLQVLAILNPQFHPDLVDGIRGILLGLVMATIFRLGWQKRQRSRQSTS